MAMRPWRQELIWRIHHLGRRWPAQSGHRMPIHPFFLTLIVAFWVALTVIALLESKLRPVVAEIAAAQAQNTMTAIVEETITTDLAACEMDYHDFIVIQRDEGGAITALTTNMARMNLLRAELTAAVLDALEKIDASVIQVPLGSLFDLEPLWAKGPTIKAKAITIGTVSTEFDSQLTSAGVNQTLHRIWLEISVPMTLLLPGGTVETCLQTKLCVAETVIVGQVPGTYLQLN